MPLTGGSITGDFQVSGTVELGNTGTNTALYVTDQLVGVNTEYPNEALTVAGNISASNLIYCKNNGNASQWHSSYTTVQSNSANWNIVGDKYFTTSLTTNSINKGTKVFAVSAGLSYIPTQDITVVYDHDINHHMHGTVLDYNSSTGSLTADITSHTGTGSYSDWRINIGGTPAFVDSLIPSNNLSDVSNSATALANLSGVSKTEFANLSGNWQSVYTTFKNVSSAFLTSETDSQTLSFDDTAKNLSISNGNTISLSALVDSAGLDTGVRALSSSWQNALTTVQTNSASWSAPSSFARKFDMTYSPTTVSYSGIANSGSLTSQSVWTITKITYSSDGTISSQGTATNAVWDNRLTVSYA